MNELKGVEGEIALTIQITRAATGETETHQIVGKVISNPEPEQDKEPDHGSDTLDGRA